MPFISAYTAVSKDTQESVANLAHRSPGDFEIIYNSVDIEKFKLDNQKREKAREEWGVSPDFFLIGNVGRLAESKNQSFLLQIISQVIKEDQKILCVIVGEGPLRKNLEISIENLGLQNHVRLIGKKTDIENYYPGFDCYLATSNWEGCSITLLEAMASEIPLITTEVGIIKDHILEDCSIVIPHGDAALAANTILRLKYDPNFAHQLGRAGRHKVEQLFSIQSIANQYLSLYKKVIK